MTIMIKHLLTAIVIGTMFVFSSVASATESKYEIRADGLACPYCAYGIEKKLMAIAGVKHVDIKLKQGTVLVTGEETLNFEEQQLKTLFNDAGFTYRSMKKTTVAKAEQNNP